MSSLSHLQKNFVQLLCFAAMCLFLSPITAAAASYDVYVDKSYSGEEDGTAEKPYSSIAKAVGHGKKIYIKNGTYDEKITLPKGAGLYGQSKDKVVIHASNGTLVRAEGENSLKNITLDGGSDAVVAEGKIEISSCVVKNALQVGIVLSASGSKANISGCTIKNNGKGIYVERGRAVSISGNTVTGNGGEGVDIREKVSGTVGGNDIAQNGEGGIEIIVGSSDVSIANNQLRKNKASGIAAQFYTSASKTGTIEIKKNTVSRNGQYGMVCNAPSGGNPAGNYWDSSIVLLDNIIEGNKKKSISERCSIINAVSEEEKEANQTIESEAAQKEPEVEETPLLQEEEIESEEIKQLSEKERFLEEAHQKISQSYVATRSKLNQVTKNLKKRNPVAVFWIGNNLNEIERAKEVVVEMKEEKVLLEEALAQSAEDSDLKNSAATLVSQLEEEIVVAEKTIAEKEKAFSLFSWMFRLFKKDKTITLTQ